MNNIIISLNAPKSRFRQCILYGFIYFSITLNLRNLREINYSTYSYYCKSPSCFRFQASIFRPSKRPLSRLHRNYLRVPIYIRSSLCLFT